MWQRGRGAKLNTGHPRFTSDDGSNEMKLYSATTQKDKANEDNEDHGMARQLNN